MHWPTVMPVPFRASSCLLLASRTPTASVPATLPSTPAVPPCRPCRCCEIIGTYCPFNTTLCINVCPPGSVPLSTSATCVTTCQKWV